jgi:hypothetical protein
MVLCCEAGALADTRQRTTEGLTMGWFRKKKESEASPSKPPPPVLRRARTDLSPGEKFATLDSQMGTLVSESII